MAQLTKAEAARLWFDRIRGFMLTFGDMPLWNT
jgi:hypothetical protein